MNSVTVGDMPYRVTVRVWKVDGRGLVATALGGETPHVGGVAVAVPRKKTGEEGLTADVSQICVPGHKDVLMAGEIAKALAVGTNQTVSVTAGVHTDDAQIEEIALLMQNAMRATEIWLQDYS